MRKVTPRPVAPIRSLRPASVPPSAAEEAPKPPAAPRVQSSERVRSRLRVCRRALRGPAQRESRARRGTKDRVRSTARVMTRCANLDARWRQVHLARAFPRMYAGVSHFSRSARPCLQSHPQKRCPVRGWTRMQCGISRANRKNCARDARVYSYTRAAADRRRPSGSFPGGSAAARVVGRY